MEVPSKSKIKVSLAKRTGSSDLTQTHATTMACFQNLSAFGVAFRRQFCQKQPT